MIKGLTISQPYASLIASGEKWVENRTWPTDYRGLLAIHAGKGTQYLNRHELRRYPTGSIVAVVMLRACIYLDYARKCLEEGRTPFVGWKQDGLTYDDMERLLSHPHAEGPYCWLLQDVTRLPEPVPCTGKYRLWDVPVRLELPITLTQR